MSLIIMMEEGTQEERYHLCPSSILSLFFFILQLGSLLAVTIDCIMAYQSIIIFARWREQLSQVTLLAGLVTSISGVYLRSESDVGSHWTVWLWLAFAVLFIFLQTSRHQIDLWVETGAVYAGLCFLGKICSADFGKLLDPMRMVLITWCMGFVVRRTGTLPLVGPQRLLNHFLGTSPV